MKEYGLLGYPLSHSFSRGYFTRKFECENIDALYLNFELSDVQSMISAIEEHPLLVGFNVTIPHKQSIIPYLDALSDEASGAGAVNVVKITRNNDTCFLKGYNSDIIGFEKAFTPLLQPEFHTKALIMGTGGASKAVAYVLKKWNIETLFVSRNPHLPNEVSYSACNGLLKEYRVIINCSPVGTFPHVDEAPAIDYSQITEKHYLFDLVYNPEETLFLKKGKQQGAQTKNGRDMLEIQAEAAWSIWNANE